VPDTLASAASCTLALVVPVSAVSPAPERDFAELEDLSAAPATAVPPRAAAAAATATVR
jgi:hypothetical protein